jgi:hypothetical protein
MAHHDKKRRILDKDDWDKQLKTKISALCASKKDLIAVHASTTVEDLLKVLYTCAIVFH